MVSLGIRVFLVSVDFATGWLDGAEALQKLSSESLEAVSEFSAFVKKLSKLEKQFGVELSQLIAKDGKKREFLRRLEDLADPVERCRTGL